MKLKSVLKHFFKMTGWTQTVLENYVDLLTGFPFKSEFFSDDVNDIPLVKGDNLHQQYIDWETAKKWNQEDLKNLEKYQLQVDDIVLAMDRPWIEAGLKYAWIKKNDPKSLLVQRVSRLRGKNGLETNYLRYIIGSPDFTGYLKNIVTGVTVPHISPKQILSFKFKLPPLATQQKIASILSAYDELIENNKQRIKLLEEMAEEIYKEWFVRLRFPNYENTEFVNGLPKGWENGKVEDFFKTSSGGTPSRQKESEYYGGAIDWIKTGELKDTFIQESEEKITEIGLKNSSAKLFPPNTLLMAMYGVNIGQLGISVKASSANQAVCVFTPIYQNRYSLFYSFFFFKSIRTQLFNMSMGAAQQNLSQEIIKRINFTQPTADLLNSFNKIQEPLFEEIKLLQQKNQLFQQTRDLLLPRLISGKLSVEGLAEAKEYALGQNPEQWPMAAEVDYHHS